MNETCELISVNPNNVDEYGFFCYMSKRKAPGYQQKSDWLAARFTEGLKLHMVHETDGRTVGFIDLEITLSHRRSRRPIGRYILSA